MLTWTDPKIDCDGSRSVATFELANLRFECTAYSDGSYGIDAAEISVQFPALRVPKKRIFVATGAALSHPHESTEYRINRIAAKQALEDKLRDALTTILAGCKS